MAQKNVNNQRNEFLGQLLEFVLANGGQDIYTVYYLAHYIESKFGRTIGSTRSCSGTANETMVTAHYSSSAFSNVGDGGSETRTHICIKRVEDTDGHPIENEKLREKDHLLSSSCFYCQDPWDLKGIFRVSLSVNSWYYAD